MFKIGLSTAILWNYRELNIPKVISHAVNNLNFEAVEIHCEDPFFEGWGTQKAEDTKKDIRDVLTIVDAEVSLHAPYHDSNIAALNNGIGKEILRQQKECVETARYLDSEIVVVHPGFVSSRKYERKMSFEKMVENLRKITEFAEDSGVKICLENLAAKEKAMCVGIRELKEVLRRVNMDNLRITLDVAHANTTKKGPVQYARELKGHIGHIHASENTGEDNHLTIGQGNIDFEIVMEKLQPFSGVVMVEGWIPRNEEPFIIHDRKELEKVRKKVSY